MPGGTIFALSTAPGRAAIAVVRVSGPVAGLAVERIGGCRPAPRRMRYAALADPDTGAAIDRGLVVLFPAPASATGEDLAEFHVHGGPAVVAALLAALGRIPDCRPAAPGEFTRRGFDNGKLDLSAAEGIADLIAAETAAQHAQALAQAGGSLARLAADWSRRLTRLLAHLEAAIDFADEDLPPTLAADVAAGATILRQEIEAALDDKRRGEILRDGFAVALIGPPNSGKSSLLNALAGRDAAIVSAIAGTTRDVIEVHLDLGGYSVILADTAGLRDSADPIEQAGIARARARADSADLRLLVLDATKPDYFGETPAEPVLRVLNKSDLSTDDVPAGGIIVSALTGSGLDRLTDAIATVASSRLAGEPPAITRARHRTELAAAAQSLGRASAVGEIALMAEDLRLALRSIGGITGQVDVEDLLDVIFRDFCLGK